MKRTALAFALAAAGLTALPVGAAPVLFSDFGNAPADITDTVDAFRAALGANNGAGPAPGAVTGRREINWDAAGLDAVADPALMPADQFNRAAAPFARGAQFSTAGTGFMVSRRAAQGGDPLFGFAANGVFLQAFSQERVFAPVGAHVMDVTFDVPGTPGSGASVSAFGAVFVDVEVADLSALEFFAVDGASLGKFFVPVSADGGLSFLGVQFSGGERVGRVQITTGDYDLTANGQIAGNNDFVVLDDFIYAEPQRVPAPGTLALLGLGFAATGFLRRRTARA